MGMVKKNRFRKKVKQKRVSLIEALTGLPDDSEDRLIYPHPTQLSPEQVIFCQELIAHGYKIAPTVRATFGELADEWSDSKVQQVGQKLLALPKIKLYVQEQLELRVEKLKTTADWIAQKYKDWATLNVTDYIGVKYHEKTGRPQIILKQDLEELPDNVRSAIRSIKTTQAGDVSVEFVDQKGALDTLTKMLGYMNQKIDVDVKSSVVLNFDSQDAEA